MEQREIDEMFEDYWRFSAARRQRLEDQHTEEWGNIFVVPVKTAAVVIPALFLGYCAWGLM